MSQFTWASCSVENCNNEDCNQVFYFRLNFHPRKYKWLMALGLPFDTTLQDLKVCSKHFCENDFLDCGNSSSKSGQLKYDAVPHLFVPEAGPCCAHITKRVDIDAKKSFNAHGDGVVVPTESVAKLLGSDQPGDNSVFIVQNCEGLKKFMFLSDSVQPILCKETPKSCSQRKIKVVISGMSGRYSLCRICCSPIFDARPYSSECHLRKDVETIQLMLKSILPKSEWSMYHNQKICESCLKLTEKTYSLIQLYVKTTETLTELLEKTNDFLVEDETLLIAHNYPLGNYGKPNVHAVFVPNKKTSSSQTVENSGPNLDFEQVVVRHDTYTIIKQIPKPSTSKECVKKQTVAHKQKSSILSKKARPVAKKIKISQKADRESKETNKIPNYVAPEIKTEPEDSPIFEPPMAEPIEENHNDNDLSILGDFPTDFIPDTDVNEEIGDPASSETTNATFCDVVIKDELDISEPTIQNVDIKSEPPEPTKEKIQIPKTSSLSLDIKNSRNLPNKSIKKLPSKPLISVNPNKDIINFKRVKQLVSLLKKNGGEMLQVDAKKPKLESQTFCCCVCYETFPDSGTLKKHLDDKSCPGARAKSEIVVTGL